MTCQQIGYVDIYIDKKEFDNFFYLDTKYQSKSTPKVQ